MSPLFLYPPNPNKILTEHKKAFSHLIYKTNENIFATK